MIARLLQALWCALLAAAVGAALLSAHWLGRWIGVWPAALGGVMAVLLLHPLAVSGNFVLSRLFGDAVPAPLRLSPRRALAMLDREIDASIRGVWIANPFQSRRIGPTGAATRRHAILFVHGYFCNRAVWHPFVRDATRRGYRCEALTLDVPFGSIDRHVDAIDAALEALSPGGDPVFVVAHSMGGLVVRSALRTIAHARVAHVVTLGSPHHGTWNARFGRGGAARQMRIDSPWLAALSIAELDGRAWPRDALTSIHSVHDEIVYPQSTSQLEGADNVAIGGCGHVALLYDERVRSLVFERLDRRDAAQPAGASNPRGMDASSRCV